MDRKCRNCEHFRKGSAGSAKHVWGECLKPGQYSYDSHDRDRPGAFTWADKSCDDFEPRKTPADQSVQDSW